MKKICIHAFGFLMAVLLCLSCITPMASALSVEYKLPDTAIIVGSNFNLDIVVNGADFTDPILTFGFDVSADALEFNYLGASVATPPFNDVSASLPDTDVAGITFPGVIGDDILLASLRFETIQTGDFFIDIKSDLTDPNEGLVTLSQRVDLSRQVAVNVAPVPEPGTLLLMIAGIGGLGFLKRKRS